MSSETTVDFGDLGGFPVEPQCTLDDLVAIIDSGIESSDPEKVLNAREAITRIRQRVFVSGESIAKGRAT